MKTDTYTPVSGSTKLSFSIPSTPAMAPTCRLVVYSMKQGGEIVVDTLNIKVENPFQNEVSILLGNNQQLLDRVFVSKETVCCTVGKVKNASK